MAKCQQAPNMLQQVDAGEIFTALAWGIADIQPRMDDHSFAQRINLLQYGITLSNLSESEAVKNIEYRIDDRNKIGLLSVQILLNSLISKCQHKLKC